MAEANVWLDADPIARGGSSGREIAAVDWRAHPLGPRAEWPTQLSAMLATMLASPQPMFLAWGPDLHFFYNDAYRPLLGARVERTPGQRFADLWSEEWPDLEPVVARALAGEGVRFEEWPLRVLRNGYPEDTWWTFSYMPLLDAAGAIAGMWCVTNEATAQVLGRQAAAAERERQQRLVEQMPGFVAVLRGADHVYEYVNDAYRTISGERDFVGRPVREVFPELDGQGFHELLDQVFASGRRYVATGLPIDLSTQAETRFIDLLFEPIVEEGAVTGIFVGGYDATEAYRTVAALAESEERLRLVIEGARDHAILTTDPDGIVTSWSAGAQAIFGWRADEIVGQRADLIFTPEDRADGVPDRELARARDAGCANDERWHLRSDGSRVFMNGSVHPLRRDATGPLQGFIKIARDESERRRILDELRDLNDTLEARVEERTRELRDSMDFTRLALSAVGGVGVWTFDVATDCFTCDANIARLYDIDPAEAAAGIPREHFLGNVHDDDRGALATVMQRGLVNPGDLELEYRIVHRDRSIHWVLSRGHTYFDESGNPVRRTGVGVELTQQRELEEQLRQSQKMEAVGQLTGGIAHDFNNLLQGITGSLELIQRKVSRGQTGDLERFITGATTAASRAAALTHRLLAFSRRQPIDPRPVHANNLVASMEDMLRRTLGEQVALHLDLAPSLWTTRCDPNQLENAILNLVINARDAMPDGGTLTIESCNVDLQNAAKARQHGAKPGQYICLSVSDTGTGMSADTMAKAFEPFFTTKPIGQGTGLGLSMIYGFARQSEGQARIDSKEGEGTNFLLYLPRHRGGEAPDQQPAPVEEEQVGKHGEVVLVVEDEAIVRTLIVEELAELGYTAIEAEDGPSGLALLQSNRRIDLLITDIGLPGLNGRQVADAARALRPELKILFMTGYAENAALASGFLGTGMAMITKPFAMTALATRIRTIIEGDQAPAG